MKQYLEWISKEKREEAKKLGQIDDAPKSDPYDFVGHIPYYVQARLDKFKTLDKLMKYYSANMKFIPTDYNQKLYPYRFMLAPNGLWASNANELIHIEMLFWYYTIAKRAMPRKMDEWYEKFAPNFLMYETYEFREHETNHINKLIAKKKKMQGKKLTDITTFICAAESYDIGPEEELIERTPPVLAPYKNIVFIPNRRGDITYSLK